MTEPSGGSGQLWVVSAPSGVGKSTILKAVLEQEPELRFSVSRTTRAPRPGEVPGRDYHFISRAEFEAGIGAGRFLEWARVHDQFYGTDRAPIETWLQAGHDVILDIDVQGARQVRAAAPGLLSVFILPPSFAILEQRLRGRGTEAPDQVARRLGVARRELEEVTSYDYLIVNDRLAEAVADCLAVIRAARLTRLRQAERARAFFHLERP
ncbi:MAG: guanylate kinase [Syntrophobacteraceae bacterium CG07_land_8_20_14_0_80_61_8]|nr:MAG: guanylate kinase [Syntrophobacteraceae bacterium CG07_land_8_20_14_0_80_61_8]